MDGESVASSPATAECDGRTTDVLHTEAERAPTATPTPPPAEELIELRPPCPVPPCAAARGIAAPYSRTASAAIATKESRAATATSAALLARQAAVGPEERERIAALSQDDPQWLWERWGVLSASNYWAASGAGGPRAKQELLREMVWPEDSRLRFGSVATNYGKAHEAVAVELYVTDRRAGTNRNYAHPQCNTSLRGLVLHPTHPWLGASPDLVVEEREGARPPPATPPANPHHLHDPYVVSYPHGADMYAMTHRLGSNGDLGGPTVVGCAEVKCIASKNLLFYSELPANAKYGVCPKYYYQMQGQMECGEWPWNDLIVYLPTRLQVTRFWRDRKFWDEDLFPKLRSFYFDMFLPAVDARAASHLLPNTLTWCGPVVAAGTTTAAPKRQRRAQDALAESLWGEEGVEANDTEAEGGQEGVPADSAVCPPSARTAASKRAGGRLEVPNGVPSWADPPIKRLVAIPLLK